MDFFWGEGVREGFDKKQTQDSHFYDKRSHQFHLYFFSGTFLKQRSGPLDYFLVRV